MPHNNLFNATYDTTFVIQKPVTGAVKLTHFTHCFVQKDTIVAKMISTKKSSKYTDCYLKC